MFTYMTSAPLYLFFRCLLLTILFITMVHGFKASSTKNVTKLLDLNAHINTNPMFKPAGPMHMKNLALEPELFEKLHNSKLSNSAFRVTTFFWFRSTKTALQILLQNVNDFKNNLTILYSKLVNDNDLDLKSYDVKQNVSMYSALFNLYINKLTDCKYQVIQLITQVNHIFTALDQINPKHAKRGIIHSLLNFLFGHLNSLAYIESIKKHGNFRGKPRHTH